MQKKMWLKISRDEGDTFYIFGLPSAWLFFAIETQIARFIIRYIYYMLWQRYFTFFTFVLKTTFANTICNRFFKNRSYTFNAHQL